MRRRSPSGASVVTLLALAAPFAFACDDEPFPNKSQVDSVRVLAVRADLPYARPGETVKVEALVVDGRADRPRPMRVWWFPTPCVNPTGGRYYDCFPRLETRYPLGVDLGPQLVEGTTTTVLIPDDALAGVTPDPARSAEPIATSFSFFFACAGHVRRIERSRRLAENAAGFGCFDETDRQLPPSEGVFGFTRVTVTPTRRNAIPTLKGLVLRGNPIDPVKGTAIPRCDRGLLETLADDCDSLGMAAIWDDADAELDPDNVGPDGTPGRETIYTDWYVTIGRFEQERRIEFDPFTGRPEVVDVLYEPQRTPGTGLIWAVLHDNRGGTSWTSVPITLE